LLPDWWLSSFSLSPYTNTELSMKYNHIGIPTTERFDGEIDLPHLKVTVSDHGNNPFGIQWQRYWEDAPYPEIVQRIPHVAFEVDDLADALIGHKIIIPRNSPSTGVTVAFIEVNGAPVELMQIRQ
jgi:hypothetical protein